MKPNPGTAAILSFLIPGLGYMYIGRIVEGLGILALVVVLGLLGMKAANPEIELLSFLAVPTVWLLNIFASYHAAEKNQLSVPRRT